MNLYILRHAIAADPGDPGMPADLGDFDRPLTAEGRRKLRRSIAGMKAAAVRFDLVASSPLVRAIQTAEVVMKDMAIPRDALIVTGALAPGGSRAALVREVNRLAERAGSIVLVGHEPGLSELIGLFCSGRDDASIELKKGGLAKLESARLRTGRCATLEWLLTPKQLRAMAR